MSVLKNTRLELKVCGMRDETNLQELFRLDPDYIGMIFYSKSARFFSGDSISIPKEIQKVGVFVNESIPEIIQKVKQHDLKVVQIHGDESAEFCKDLKDIVPELKIWKVFSVGEDFDMGELLNYHCVDAIVFDTKGENYGGNGTKFNWGILENYTLNQDIVLSGGITIEDLPKIIEMKQRVPQIRIIDINSRFEIEPGIKNIKLVKEFSQKLKELQ